MRSRPLLLGPLIVSSQWVVLESAGLHGSPGRFAGAGFAVALACSSFAAVARLRWGFRHWLLDALFGVFNGLAALAATAVSCLALVLATLTPLSVGVVSQVIVALAWLTVATVSLRTAVENGTRTQTRSAVLALAVILPVTCIAPVVALAQDSDSTSST